MKHPLQCRCGTLKGTVETTGGSNHVVCYCTDCQAFARTLGKGGDVLDAQGGSEVVQTLPRNVAFTEGRKALACLRLTDTGMVRWYAACCDTPIGNTLATPKMSFVGLVVGGVIGGRDQVAAAFGPVRSWANVEGALGAEKPKQVGLGRVIAWFLRTVIGARLSGAWKQTPFFDVATGAPAATPRVLSADELARAKAA